MSQSSRARKTSVPPSTLLRKQTHGSAYPDQDSRTNAIPTSRKLAYPGLLQRRPTTTNSSRAWNAQNVPRPLITSHPYEIIGVAGFHHSARPPITGSGSPRPEHGLKPPPRKNVDSFHSIHGPKVAGDIPTSRGGIGKGLARRSRAVTHMTSSRKRDLLGQQMNQVDSTVYANIVFGFGKTSRRNGHYGPSSEEEQITAEPKNNVGQDHAPVAIVDNAPWKAMTAAFGALSLSTTAAAKKRHLPFLRRIVRSSFHRRCQKRGLATVPTSPSTQLLTICYKMAMDVSDSGLYNDPTEYVVYKVELTVGKLVCPLCDTLGGITTKEMLEAHLEWDHLEMEPSWRQKQSGNWELTLEIPGSEVQGDVWERAESSCSSSPTPSDRHWSSVETSQVPDVGAKEQPTSLPESPDAAKLPGQLVSDFKFKRELSPVPRSRATSLSPVTISTRVNQEQATRDPLGPLAIYPYLLSRMDDSEITGVSCRPCGPRLFDLIAQYPTFDCGLTSWSLLERDEELFEIDDVRDEEKAMQALWNRWIFFRRRQLFLDSHKMMIEFVDTFLPIIKETAGWKGLRVWLLLLAKLKYLTGDDVVTIMGYYEDAAGIKS